MSRTPTVGSLFSGAGGFDLGFDRAGFDLAWQVEIDRTARDVLARHWPGVERHTDVRDCGRANLAPVDVLVGGFPCQDISHAGNREGLAGERSGLFYQFARVASELRPRFLVFENVPGLLSSDANRDLRRVCSALAELGYFGAWRTLDSEHAGVPQLRRRVFGVFAARLPGERGGLAEPEPGEDGRRLAGLCASVLALTQVPQGHPAACKKAWKKAAAAAGAGAQVVGTLQTTGRRSGHRIGADEAAAGHLVYGPRAFDIYNQADRGGTVGTLHAGQPGHSGPQTIVYQCHGSNVGPMGHLRAGNGHATCGVPFVVNSATSCAKQDHARQVDVARSLDTCPVAQGQGGNVIVFNPNAAGKQTSLGVSSAHAGAQGAGMGTRKAVVIAENQRDELRTSDVAGALSTGGGKAGRGEAAAWDGADVRRLTPLEYERLMGWPDDWTRYRADGREIKDGPRYRMCGNGVVEPVARWLARRLKAHF